MTKEMLHKFESSSHHLHGTSLLATTEAGPIYRMPIPNIIYANQTDIEIPDYIEKVLRTPRNRSRFMHTVNWNSRIGPRWLGKPNSAFFLCDGSKSNIDYLEETTENQRIDSSKLHDYLREHFDYSNSGCIYGKVSSLSGHIAPLNITEKNISHIFTFDAFCGPDSYKDMGTNMKIKIGQLYSARILPLTQDGYLIKVKK